MLDELQHIADSSDTLRRNRGRRGLEILSRMQKEPGTPVEIVEDDVPDVAEVDAKLVALARARSRVILTNDFNLNRVAELQGVRVMNINSLANAVKPAVLPGEELRVRVIQEGKEAGQGVGFLDDGTMIVVEGGARHIDHDVDVSVTRVLQTVAGTDDLRPAATRLSAAAPRDPTGGSPVADAIVVAAGPLGRMGGTDKLFAPVGGRPLLAWTLDALDAVAEVERIVVVTAAERVAEVRAARVAAAVRGRGRRGRGPPPGSRSRRGCAALDDASGRTPATTAVVLVHDGARPLVVARTSCAAVDPRPPPSTARPSRSLPVAETVKRVDGDRSSADRRPRRAGIGADAAGRPAPASSARRSTATRPTGRRPGPMRPRCWRPVPSRSMSCLVTRAISR